MAADKSALPLRIVIDDPIPGVAIALQRGSGNNFGLIGPVGATAAVLVFELDIIVDGNTAEGGPRLLGPFVQGPPSARFVYLNIGTMAGQIDSPWQRRAKVPLGGITRRAIDALAPGQRLTAHIASRDRHGAPACATVPVPAPGWQIE